MVGNIITTAFVWALLLTAMRASAVGMRGLSPVAAAGWHFLRCRSGNKELCRRRFTVALDKAYIRLLSTVSTASSGTLLYTGILLTGMGCVVGASNNLLKFVDGPTYWFQMSQSVSTVSMPLITAGLSVIMVAVSPNKRVSAFLGLIFVLLGAAIGIAHAALG